ncbi:hypothetical protein E4U22_003394, partial [Claviceps purpurea]
MRDVSRDSNAEICGRGIHTAHDGITVAVKARRFCHGREWDVGLPVDSPRHLQCDTDGYV